MDSKGFEALNNVLGEEERLGDEHKPSNEQDDEFVFVSTENSADTTLVLNRISAAQREAGTRLKGSGDVEDVYELGLDQVERLEVFDIRPDGVILRDPWAGDLGEKIPSD